MLHVSRIVNIAKKTDQRTAAISELMKIVLAQNHSASRAQPLHDFRIFSRHTMLKKRAACGCSRFRGIDNVFQRDGNAMQRSAPLLARDLDLRSPRFGQRGFSSHRNERIQLRIQFLDAIQTIASQFDWRNFPPPQMWRKLNDRSQNRHSRSTDLIVVDRWIAFTIVYPVIKKQPTAKAYNQNRCSSRGR